MKIITHKQLEALLLSIKSATFASFVSVTEAQKSKAKDATVVLKHSKNSVMLRWDYSNSVNNQSHREGGTTDFKAQPRKWGERVEDKTNCPVIHHTNAKGEFKRYIHAKVEKNLEKPRYFVDGSEVNKESVEHLLRQSRKASTQSHLEKEVICRDYAFDSISQINFGGETYKVVPK